jgi:DNA-binding NarL/FixJ family response regulator
MSERILIVEDEPAIRSSMRGYLEDEGFIIIEGPTVPEALATFRAHQPDLVLLDLHLPKADGINVLREIRAQNEAVPVIIVSGAGQMSDVVAALRLGAWDYLVKPIADLGVLAHAVRKCLERARLLRENEAYHSKLEEMVQQRTAELEAANASLERKTVALQEVLLTFRIDSDRRITRAVERIGQFCRPALAELREILPLSRRKLVDQIEAAITDATSQSVDVMAGQLTCLSPAELRICELIRRGMGSKEIAAETGISVETVDTHRRNVRRKLKINNESVNLSTYLQSLLAPSGRLESNTSQA